MFKSKIPLFFIEDSAFRLGFCRFLFFGWLYYVCASNRYFLSYVDVPEIFWIPHGVLSFLHHKLEFSDQTWLSLFQIWQVSLILSAIGLLTRWCTFAAAVLGTFFIGYSYCFGYMTHTYQPVVLGLWILCFAKTGDGFSLDQLIRKRLFKAPHQEIFSIEYGWPIRYIQALFVIIFFSAGVSKILVGGVDWVTSDHFKSVMLRSFLLYPDIHGQVSIFRLNEFIARYDWLCHLLASMTILVELSSPAAFFSKRSRPWVLGSLLAMQTMIYLTVYVNFSMYFCIYIFWVPWNNLFNFDFRRQYQIFSSSK